MIGQRQFPNPSFAALPTMYDLPSEDGDELVLSDAFYLSQSALLNATLRLPNYSAEAVLTACDVSLYYDPRHDFWHNRLDWSLYLGVNRENVVPFLVVQLLAPSPEDADRERRMQVTGRMGKPLSKPEMGEWDLDGHYYVVFDRYENQVWVFEPGDGCYRSVELLASRFWFETLQLGLGVWSGSYQGIEGQWLRWYDAANVWIPTEVEARRSAEQQVQQESDRADEAQLKADRLAAKLRSMGVDPDAVD
jgi:Putative restriction endonuclease